LSVSLTQVEQIAHEFIYVRCRMLNDSLFYSEVALVFALLKVQKLRNRWRFE